MYNQAKKISSWGNNVYVKIPVTNTKGQGSYNLIKKLSNENIKLNITAIFTEDQVTKVINSLWRDIFFINYGYKQTAVRYFF